MFHGDTQREHACESSGTWRLLCATHSFLYVITFSPVKSWRAADALYVHQHLLITSIEKNIFRDSIRSFLQLNRQRTDLKAAERKLDCPRWTCSGCLSLLVHSSVIAKCPSPLLRLTMLLLPIYERITRAFQWTSSSAFGIVACELHSASFCSEATTPTLKCLPLHMVRPLYLLANSVYCPINECCSAFGNMATFLPPWTFASFSALPQNRFATTWMSFALRERAKKSTCAINAIAYVITLQ